MVRRSCISNCLWRSICNFKLSCSCILANYEHMYKNNDKNNYTNRKTINYLCLTKDSLSGRYMATITTILLAFSSNSRTILSAHVLFMHSLYINTPSPMLNVQIIHLHHMGYWWVFAIGCWKYASVVVANHLCMELAFRANDCYFMIIVLWVRRYSHLHKL